MINKKSCPMSLSNDVIKEYTKLSGNGLRSRSQLIDDDLLKVIELRRKGNWPPGTSVPSQPTVDLEKIIEDVVLRILKDNQRVIPLQEVEGAGVLTMVETKQTNSELARKAASSITSILRSREAKP